MELQFLSYQTHPLALAVKLYNYYVIPLIVFNGGLPGGQIYTDKALHVIDYSVTVHDRWVSE